MLGLPREIRDQIYKLVLSEAVPIEINQRHLSPGLLGTCKLLRFEASPYLYGNAFEFTTWTELHHFLLQIGSNVRHLQRIFLDEPNQAMLVDVDAGVYLPEGETWDPMTCDFVKPLSMSTPRMYYVSNKARACFELLKESSVTIIFRLHGHPHSATGIAKFYDALRGPVRLLWTGSLSRRSFQPFITKLGEAGWKMYVYHSMNSVTSGDRVCFSMTMTDEIHHAEIQDHPPVQGLEFAATGIYWDGQFSTFDSIAKGIAATGSKMLDRLCSAVGLQELPAISLEDRTDDTYGWWAGASMTSIPKLLEQLNQGVPSDEHIRSRLKTLSHARKQLFAYIQHLSSQTADAVVRTRWCNTDEPRSVRFTAKGVEIGTQLLPLSVVPLLYVYIVYLQPLTDYLLILLGEEPSTLEVRSHLWRCGGRVWTPQTAREVFIAMSNESFNIYLPIRAWQEIQGSLDLDRTYNWRDSALVE